MENFMENATVFLLDSYRTEAEESEQCGDAEFYTLGRFIFLMVASFVAWLGTCGNLLLIYIFITRSYPTSTKYPTVLAILDALICILYIMLFGVDAAIVYLQASSLFKLYHIYIVPAFVISRITQLAIPYLLILTTLERFVWTSGQETTRCLRQMFSDRGRQVTIVVLLLACTILRLPTAFAIVVHHFPNCDDFLRTQSTGPADWVYESKVYHFFDFHLLSIAQTFIPFIVLVIFNFIIIRKLLKENLDEQVETDHKNSHYLLHLISNNHHHLQQQHQSQLCKLSGAPPLPLPMHVQSNQNTSIDQSKQKSPLIIWGSKFTIIEHGNFLYQRNDETSIQMKKQSRKLPTPVRDAVCTMFAIVTSYLISNSLHLILTILERSKISILRDPNDPMMASTFHTVFSDTVSFVYMFTSAIRIIIYMCNPSMRLQLKDFLSYDQRCTRRRGRRRRRRRMRWRGWRRTRRQSATIITDQI